MLALPGKSTTLNWMFSLFATGWLSTVTVGSKKNVSCGDIFWNTTFEIEVLPDLIGLTR